MDMTLFEVDEAATRIRDEVDGDADIIVGAIFDQALEGKFRLSLVATGLSRAPDRDGLTIVAPSVHAVSH
jgi:cell division protein FtsZ